MHDAYKFQWGQPVTAAIDLVNDGSFPGAELEGLLIERGTRGEIVQTGMHETSKTPVYLVEFEGGKVIGCLENEIVAA